jgi:DNA-binding PadR family transcriptional regulator
MRTSSTSGFDLRGFELPDFDLRGALNHLRKAFGVHGSGRGGQRDIRDAILIELADEPMHGYQLIQAIETRSGGAWTPSPGTVYPTLQLLVDEGLATGKQSGERKVYTLTAAGKEAAAAVAEADAAGAAQHPSGARRNWDERAALPKAGVKLGQALSQVTQHATKEQQERALAIVDEARRKLYAILAEE